MWQNENDTGQTTNNVYIIAHRHLTNNKSTTVDIINEVQSSNTLYPITKENTSSAQLVKMKPITIQLINSIPKIHSRFQFVVGIGQSDVSTLSCVSGVSIFTNLVTGDQPVGSSVNVVVRLLDYFKIQWKKKKN